MNAVQRNVPDLYPSKSMEKRIEPGGIEIESCFVVSPKNGMVDITALVTNVMMYEDIMSPFITGSVSVVDALSLNEILPLMGEEILYIKALTPGFDGDLYKRDLMLALYKMEKRENIKLKAVGYELCFVSMEAITDMNQRVSKTFRGRISDLAESMIKSFPGLVSEKNANVEETANNEIYTSNFWTPTQNLYYLSTKALNEINNPSYVFFENNEGFVFASLDALYAIPATYQFIRDSKMRGPEETQDVMEEYRKVLDISVPVQYDYIERLQEGFYGSTIYNYDLQTKRINFKNFVAFDDLKKVRLNPHLNIGDNLQFMPEANMLLSVMHRSLYNGSPILPINHHNRRMALLKQVSSMTINIKVFGRLDYTVGSVVDFTAYKDNATGAKLPADEDTDELLTGRYLITAISHEISRENHFCHIELCKDSVLKNINKMTEQ